MRFSTILWKGKETACVAVDGGYLPLEEIFRRTGEGGPGDLLSLIRKGLPGRVPGIDPVIRAEEAIFAPPFRRPGKIWGIGLNYAAHASDLSETAPTRIPASFMKPDTAIIGPGEPIRIPAISRRTTGEAELGLVIGKRCRNVPRDHWLDVVAGFVPVIDMTAEDILRQNPRYLTLSKSFDTFFSFGPELVTPDEVPDPFSLQVATRINGRTHAENVVANMTFPPDFLVSFHSKVMTLCPGDIISTGTPGAVPLSPGDTVSCRITGLAPLSNPVDAETGG